MDSKKFSLKSRLGSIKFAFRGLLSLLKNEHNSRIHLLAATGAIAAGILLRISISEWSILIIVIGIVFLTELLNTSLETLADHVDPEWNNKIRQVKDYASAAVLIAAIISVITGGLIFIPKIINIM